MFQLQGQLVTEDLVCAEKARLGSLLKSRSSAEMAYGYNIDYHRCFWRVNPKRNGYLKGSVFSLFHTTSKTDSIGFDLRAGILVDSVVWHQQKMNFKRKGDAVFCFKPGGWLQNEADSLTIYYQGNPQAGSGFGYYVWDNHQTGPIIHTLSEPYGAAYWWPCKQTLADKIDSIDIFVSTVPGFKVGSNGVLVSSDSINDSTLIVHWKHRYPIVTYLVAFATSNYQQFAEYAKFYNRPDSLLILNYVFPQSLAEAKKDVADIKPIIQLFDSLFGDYPFKKEKYGHAQFTWGGGMEHQTMSFMVNFNFDLQAHELAHQWFGNKITCGSWADLWLNEGFATYCTALCHEFLRPYDWLDQLRGIRNSATSQKNGSIYVQDTLTINRLFNGSLTYSKGAFLLHMLRVKLGDEAFFRGVRAYLTQNNLSYQFATTSDFQTVMAKESGQNLDTFFMRWFKGEGFPYLKINWQQVGKEVTVRIIQTQSHPSVPFFELIIPIRFRNAQDDSIFVFRPSVADQQFTITLPFAADSAEFDPFVTVLAKYSLGGINLDLVNTGQFSLAPNPASDMLTIKSSNNLAEKIEIFNLMGQKVYETPAGKIYGLGDDIEINLSELSSGTYVTRIHTKKFVTSLKLNKI